MTVKFSLLCARLVSQFYNFFCRDSDLESPCSFRENVNTVAVKFFKSLALIFWAYMDEHTVATLSL